MCLSCQDVITKLPSFYNLIHLEVTAWFYMSYGYLDMGDQLPSRIVGTLLDLLHVSPYLESLVINEGYYEYESNYNDCRSVDLIPQCLLLHLKSIEFRRFWWNQFEMDMVRFFLKNAKVLQRDVHSIFHKTRRQYQLEFICIA
ncbi:hypothetical protein MKW94_023198 [Papaver nudicaule]|uniref:FBD domain-containing protein n=1 Tax=Papaver nudicaule TaxID=74823 RepID=A0AA41RL29_PAPNU|nr:hypothetical protein [Papaver nudicaule]